MFFCDLGQGDHMSFAYIGKDFYLVASPKGGSLSKSGGKKSSGTARARGELQNLFYPSCPEPCSSRRAVPTLPCRMLLFPAPHKCLVKEPPVAAWNSHLHLQSPTERFPALLSSTKMDQAQGNICVARIAVFWANIWPLHTHYSFNFWSWCLSLVKPLMSLHISAPGLAQCWGFSRSQHEGKWCDPGCPRGVSPRSCAGDSGSSCWEFCSNMEAVGRWSLAAAGSASSSYSFLWVPFHNNLNLFSILMLRPSKILLCSWLHAFVTSNCTGSVESYFHYLAFSLFLCNNPLLNVRLCLSSALCLTPATVLPALLSPASIRASQLVLRVFVVICALMSNPEASKRRWDTVSLRAQGCGCLPA